MRQVLYAWLSVCYSVAVARHAPLICFGESRVPGHDIVKRKEREAERARGDGDAKAVPPGHSRPCRNRSAGLRGVGTTIVGTGNRRAVSWCRAQSQARRPGGRRLEDLRVRPGAGTGSGGRERRSGTAGGDELQGGHRASSARDPDRCCDAGQFRPAGASCAGHLGPVLPASISVFHR